MNVAVVHYHLQDGGVAEVIRRMLPVMAGKGVRQIVFTGGDEARHDWHRTVDGLGYGSPPITAQQLLDRLQAAALDAFGAPPEIWHFHNHSLGKNPLVPHIVERLAQAGERLLLQIHDLAEDGRPGNARNLSEYRRLYPAGPRVCYAFLNHRDRDRFIDAGLRPEHAHLLRNPVSPSPFDISPSRHPLLLAPVRGIRRKNLGELVLLSCLAPPGSRIAVTRAPRDESARILHDAWQWFAGDLSLPVDFNVVDRIAPCQGSGCSFDDWLAGSSHIVTTSIAEGFGLPFLEAVAWGRPLLGRDLPQLTDDHAANGIRHSRLYSNLLVPADWIDMDILLSVMKRGIESTHAAWDKQAPADEPVWMCHGDHLDFGNLPESLQRQVIRRVTNPGEAAHIMVRTADGLHGACGWLAAALANREPDADPAELSPWSPEICSDRLAAIYQDTCAETEDSHCSLDANRILESGLHPRSFHILAASVENPGLRFRAVVFDIYGTLLDAAPGGVKPDPAADPMLREWLAAHGYDPPDSPSGDLHQAVLRHHAASAFPHPEVDLRDLWREVLGLPADHDTTSLVTGIENLWHPARWIPGAENAIRRLISAGVPLGLLSNAQCNTLDSLCARAGCFEPDLTVLSYRHGIAKPSPEIFALLRDRLRARGIAPAETLFIGNDPLQDIAPAAVVGLRTALFTGHPGSWRPGACDPEFTIRDWSQLEAIVENGK
ncbi:MAG TPA: HAD family hydrolase [Luteolibacter sp.]|nr:HAD family hydrolase [Luteolibacter sp.]